MRYYGCVITLAVCLPLAWGADPVHASYHVETVAGSSRIGDGGPPLAAQFSAIQGIALDRLGTLFIADTDNHRIRKVSGGVISTIAGTGSAGYSGDNGSALSAQLNLPYGLALDAAGNLYVADYGNHRVRRITPGGIITTVAGTGRQASSPDGAAPTDTSLLHPRNVAVDGAGNLYIAEFEGHRVRKLTPDGKLATVAGTGVAGWSGDGGRANAAQVNYPAGMAFDRAGALYIADSGNHIVRKLYADGTIGTIGAPTGVKGETVLVTPTSLAMDAAGTLYVGDPTTFVILAFTTAAKWVPRAGTGEPAYSGDGGPALSAALNSVNDLTIDQGGNLYIADGVRIRRIDPQGVIASAAGDGYVHSVGDGGPATAAELYQPSAIALDSAGNLFIADSGTQRVRQVARDGIVTTLAGTGTAARGAADGSLAATSALNTPMGVAMDFGGNLVVADTYNHRIVSVTAARTLRGVAGTGKPGASPEGTAPLVAQLLGPRAICLDRAGILHIVDTSNHRVLRLASGGTLQTAAGNGSRGKAGDEGAARLAQLNTPSACAADSAGNLFIADTANHAIRRVNAAGTISTVAGTIGAAGTNGDEGPATAARLDSPRGVVVDDSGNIYIADTGNHRLRLVTPDGVIHNMAGTGGAGFAGDGGPGPAAMLYSPQGLFLDGAGDLYFADSGNNRIRRLVPDAPPPPPVQTPAVTVVNALSLHEGPVSPGEVTSIFGSALGPATGVTADLDPAGLLPTSVAGVEVRFDDLAAPIFYAQSGQINVQVPYGVAGSASVRVEVRYQGKLAGTAAVAVAPSAPAILALAINSDGTTNAESAPVPRASWVTLYATGEGLTDGANVSGKPAQAPYAHPLLPVALTIAGINADILFAGSAPGLVGVLQINARVPAGFVAPGETQVELTVGTVKAPPITLWLK